MYHLDFAGQSITAGGTLELRDPDVTRSLRSHDYRMVERMGEQFLLVTPNFAGYYAVSHRTGKSQRIVAPFPVAEVAASRSWVVAVGPLGTAVFVEDHFRFCVRNYAAVTVCAFVSEPFGVLLLGGADGQLTIFDAHSGLMIRRISLDGAVPHKVMVTDGFGFIVVVVADFVERQRRWFLVVFTVNGVFVRKREIPDEVALWQQWTSAKGVDFIMFTTVSERDQRAASSFTACEVWALNFSVFKCKNSYSPIVMLSYVAQRGIFIVCQAEGRVNVFYGPSERLERPMDAKETSGA
jgi:hypothetical protein